MNEEYERIDFRPKTPFQKKRTPQYTNYKKVSNIENNKNITGIRALINEVRKQTAGNEIEMNEKYRNDSKLKTIKLNENLLTDRPTSPCFNKEMFCLMPKLKTEDQINDYNIFFNINFVVTNQSLNDQSASKKDIVDAAPSNKETRKHKKLKPIKRVKSPDDCKTLDIFEEEKIIPKVLKEKESSFKGKNENLRSTTNKTEIEELKTFLRKIYRQLNQKG